MNNLNYSMLSHTDWNELLRTIASLGLTIGKHDRKTGVITIHVHPLTKE